MARFRFREVLDGLAAVAMIAAAAALVFGVFAHRPPPESSTAPQPDSTTAAPDLPADTPVKGSRKAKVALIQFSDFLCPHCGVFAKETLPKLAPRYVAPGLVLVAFRHFPLSRLHPFAEKAAQGAECARQQERFWEMHDLLFRRQAGLTDVVVEESARQIGLDLPRFASCQEGPGKERVAADIRAAQALGVRAVPTFIIGSITAEGRVRVIRGLSGAQPLEVFTSALDAALASSDPDAR